MGQAHDAGTLTVEELRVIVAGGGTGGHFFPGLAVAQALTARAASARVLFVGARRGIEARLAPRYGFPFVALPASGFAGVGAAARLRALSVLPLAFLKSLKVLRDFRPCTVVSVGGYASFPMALAAGLAGFPVLAMEQNVHPGLANRIVAKVASAVAVSFPQTLLHFRGKARFLGNPVRASLTRVPAEVPPARPLRLLVFGGSRGARAINDAFVGAAPALLEFPGGVDIRHQTGTEDLDRVKDAYASAGVAARVEPFIEAMDEAYAWCHAAVCRAGATTLAELAAARRPALLVPFPGAAGNHQVQNARGLQALGGALCTEQKDLTTTSLLAALLRLADTKTRAEMAAKLAAVARPNATEDVADLVLLMSGVRP